MSTPLEFAGKCMVAAKGMEEVSKRGVEAGAMAMKKAVEAQAPSHLRGVGKNGAKLGVRYTLGSYPDGEKALVFVTGPFQLIERDTKKHQIPKQRSSATFEGVHGHAVIPGGKEGGVHGRRGVRTRVQHPGTQGKHPFAKATAATEVLLPKIQQVETEAVLRSIF